MLRFSDYLDICKYVFNVDKNYVAVRYIAYILLSATVAILPAVIAITYDAEKRDLAKVEETNKNRGIVKR